MKKVKKWNIVLFGALIGVINGLFGGGGGMIVVPVLTRFLGLEQKQAQATALFVILPISLISGLVYLYFNHVDISSGWWVIAGIVVGGFVGALMLNGLKNDILKGIFILFMFAGGVGMLFLG